MKKLFLALLFAGAACAVHAQVVQGTIMTVEKRTDIGYRGFAEAGAVLDFEGGTTCNLDITTTHGYLFRTGLFLGGGTGIGSIDQVSAFAIPIYANCRYYFPSRSILRAYADVRLGYNISLNSNACNSCLDGLFASVGFGLEVGRFSVSANYMPRHYEYNRERISTYFYIYDEDDWSSTLTLRVGFCF